MQRRPETWSFHPALEYQGSPKRVVSKRRGGIARPSLTACTYLKQSVTCSLLVRHSIPLLKTCSRNGLMLFVLFDEPNKIPLARRIAVLTEIKKHLSIRVFWSPIYIMKLNVVSSRCPMAKMLARGCSIYRHDLIM